MLSDLREKINGIKDKKIAVVGATGLVGREMITIFDENDILNNGNIDGYSSKKSEGMRLSSDYWRRNSIVVKNLETIDFSKYNIALFSAGSEVSKKYAPKAVESGCTVIDNTSYFRMNEDVPLVVPEINIDTVKDSKLIANPNCSTIQTVLPLKPLHDLFGLKELVISTYQSVSGAGRRGVCTFEEEIHEYRTAECLFDPEDSPFHAGILFNLVPQIGEFSDLDYTQEEWKMINETKKILGLPDLNVTATCVRVPVFVGHSVSVFAKFEKNIGNIEEVKKALNDFDGILVKDEPKPGGYALPRECSSEDYKNAVLVSRIRKHPTIENGLSFWCVADNVRKGAALNAIQIASLLNY